MIATIATSCHTNYRGSLRTLGIGGFALMSVAFNLAVATPFTFENRTQTQNRALDAFAPAQGAATAGFDADPPSRSRSVSLSRRAVVDLYRNEYVLGHTMPPIDWTGDVAVCRAGSVSRAYRQATIDRVNVFRKLARLSPVRLYEQTDDGNARVQAAALLMAANDGLSHQPAAHWKCSDAPYAGSTVGALGREGADRSNLALSSNDDYASSAVIDAYMADAGAGNVAVAHRRAILDPAQTRMAVGVIPASAKSGGHPATHALMWINFSTRTGDNASPEGVAWPPSGFIPFQLMPSESNRWSFQYPHADFSAARVSIAINDGPPIAVPQIEFRSGMREKDPRGAPSCSVNARCVPEDAIVFRPPLDPAGLRGVSYAPPGVTDKRYSVNIDGIAGPKGVPRSVAYAVIVIDPKSSVATGAPNEPTR